MSQITAIRATVQAVVFSLLTDRRAQAVAAIALSLVASVLLGSHDASAGHAVVPGACNCRP